MPTTLYHRLRHPVTRLKSDEVCCWKKHLKSGTAARSLWWVLNNYNSVKENGWCFASVAAVAKACGKLEKGKRAGSWSYDRVRHLLKEFESAGLIGSREEEDGEAGFLVFGQHMHDFLCERKGTKCTYRGWSYAAWKAKQAKKVAEEVAEQVAGKVAGQVAGQVAENLKKGSR